MYLILQVGISLKPVQASQAGHGPDGAPVSQLLVPCQPGECQGLKVLKVKVLMCHASLEGLSFWSNFWLILKVANLDARVVSAELAVDSPFPHHAAGALASTHLNIWQSRLIRCSWGTEDSG